MEVRLSSEEGGAGRTSSARANPFRESAPKRASGSLDCHAPITKNLGENCFRHFLLSPLDIRCPVRHFWLVWRGNQRESLSRLLQPGFPWEARDHFSGRQFSPSRAKGSPMRKECLRDPPPTLRNPRTEVHVCLFAPSVSPNAPAVRKVAARGHPTHGWLLLQRSERIPPPACGGTSHPFLSLTCPTFPSVADITEARGETRSSTAPPGPWSRGSTTIDSAQTMDGYASGRYPGVDAAG